MRSPITRRARSRAENRFASLAYSNPLLMGRARDEIHAASRVDPINRRKERGHDSERNAWAVRIQCVGQPENVGSGRSSEAGRIPTPDGIEFRFLAGHRGAYLRWGMGVAGAVSGAVARLPARRGGIFRRWKVSAK